MTEKRPSPGARQAWWESLRSEFPEVAALEDVPAPTASVQRVRVTFFCSHGSGGRLKLGVWSGVRVGDAIEHAERRDGGTVFVHPGETSLDARVSWSASCRACGRDYQFRWATLGRVVAAKALAEGPGYGATFLDVQRVDQDLWVLDRALNAGSDMR